MESIGDARAFLSAAREVALTKPIIVIKAGRTEAAAQAAASHTGALTGSDEVLDAAFRRCGVLRVDRIAELFYMAEVLAKQPRPRGPRLTIVTNAGGPGVLATDALIAGGGELAQLSRRDAGGARRASCPPHWSHGNPIDILGDAGPERYAKALEIAARGPEQRRPAGHPDAAGDDRPDADRRAAQAATRRSTASRCWRAGWAAPSVAAGEAILNRAGIPTFPYPDTAARVFNYMWRYSRQPARRSTRRPPAADRTASPTATAAERGRSQARARPGRTLLTEYESKQLLAAYGIPTVATRVAARRGARPSRAPARSATRSCSSSTPRRSRTRPTSAACS